MASTAAEEVVVKATPLEARSVARAAEEAADKYEAGDLDHHAEAISKAWEALLKEQTKQYGKQLAGVTAQMTKARTAGTEAAEPIIVVGGVPYQWWNLLLAGPFQLGVPYGPFMPTKIIRANEPSFAIVALWRNPFPLAGGPSAAAMMAGLSYRVNLATINLSTVTSGPAFQQPAGPVPAMFGGGFVNLWTFTFPPGTFGTPPQGAPHLFEMNATVDVVSPAGAPPLPIGLPPFAGFATWVLDPDLEPPFFFPSIPGVGPVFIPGVGKHLQHEIPCRLLVYR